MMIVNPIKLLSKCVKSIIKIHHDNHIKKGIKKSEKDWELKLRGANNGRNLSTLTQEP